MIGFSILGLFVGILEVGLGGGGGLAYVGLLTAVFGAAPDIAASASLATTIPTAALGSFSHARQGNVRWNLLPIMGTASLVGVVAGSFLSHLTDVGLSTMIFGCFSV